MHLYLTILLSCASVALANYGHYEHKCYPKVTVKHHTVPVYVPYTVYEKYPVYKYEKYPVHVPVKYPVYVKVKEEKYHGGDYKHEPEHYGGGHEEGYGGGGHGGYDEHYAAAADEPKKTQINALEVGKKA